jgi:DUF2934 family protein
VIRRWLLRADGRLRCALGDCNEEDIKRRAYDLWESAGQPKDKDEEFYRLAEQEPRNEDKSNPLRTPDTL